MGNKHHYFRLLFSLLVGVGSMVFVNQGSEFYFKYLDKTEYFTIKQPVAVDKNEYKQCDPILVDLVRTSSITSRAVSTVELILVNEKGEWYKKTLSSGEFNIDKSKEQLIHISFNLPCDINPGKYYLKTVVNYHFRGLEKNYVWQSEGFSVIALNN